MQKMVTSEILISRYAQHLEFLDDEILDINQVGLFGSQIIHLASFSGSCEDVAESIRHGADPNAIGDLGLSPLQYAVLGGKPNAVQLLLSLGADKAIENDFGETALQMAEIMEEFVIRDLLGAAGVAHHFGHDGILKSRQRWLDFKAIQEGNFASDR